MISCRSSVWIARWRWAASKKIDRSRSEMTKETPANASPTLFHCSSRWWTSYGWRSRPWTNFIRTWGIWRTQWIGCHWFRRISRAKRKSPTGWTHWTRCKPPTNCPKAKCDSCCSIWRPLMLHSIICFTVRKRVVGGHKNKTISAFSLCSCVKRHK